MSIKTANDRRVLIENIGLVSFKLDEETQPGRLFVEGKCGQVDVPTANGRTYPRSVMEVQVDKLNKRIKEGYPVLGSLDHPSDGKSKLRDASHLLHKVWIENNGSIHLRAEVLEETDNGQVAGAVLRRVKKIGMSSRGMGSTRTGPDGKEIVNEDYRLATFDFVADPAVNDAYPAIFAEDVNGAEVPVEVIKQQFPDQIKAIEEAAHQTAQRVVTLDLESQREVMVQTTLDEYKDQIHTTVYEEAKADLRDDFGVKLVRALQDHRKEIEEEIRQEIAADPTTVSAKLTLEKLAEMLIPFRPKGDAKSLLADKEEEIEGLREQVREAGELEFDSKGKLVELAKKARTLAFENHIMKATVGRDDAEYIREMVGDISTVETAQQLQDRLDTALESADANKEEAQRTVKTERARANKELNKFQGREKKLRNEVKERNERIAESVEQITNKFQERFETIESTNHDLRGQNDKLVGALERAERLIHRYDDREYASRRTVGHPDREGILEDVRSGRVKGKDGINRLAKRRDLRGEEPGGVNERVRRSMSRGREFAPQHETLTESNNSQQGNIADLAEFGLHVDDILPLSRGKQGL